MSVTLFFQCGSFDVWRKLRELPRRRELDLHAARADGGQQNACVLRAEKKGGVGRPLLHGFEQHILILFVQPRAVGEDVDLARALVRADEGVRPHAADDVWEKVCFC